MGAFMNTLIIKRVVFVGMLILLALLFVLPSQSMKWFNRATFNNLSNSLRSSALRTLRTPACKKLFTTNALLMATAYKKTSRDDHDFLKNFNACNQRHVPFSARCVQQYPHYKNQFIEYAKNNLGKQDSTSYKALKQVLTQWPESVEVLSTHALKLKDLDSSVLQLLEHKKPGFSKTYYEHHKKKYVAIKTGNNSFVIKPETEENKPSLLWKTGSVVFNYGIMPSILHLGGILKNDLDIITTLQEAQEKNEVTAQLLIDSEKNYISKEEAISTLPHAIVTTALSTGISHGFWTGAQRLTGIKVECPEYNKGGDNLGHYACNWGVWGVKMAADSLLHSYVINPLIIKPITPYLGMPSLEQTMEAKAAQYE